MNSYVPIWIAQHTRFLRADRGFHLNLRSARISYTRTAHPSPALCNRLDWSQSNPYLLDSTDVHHALDTASLVFSFLSSFLFCDYQTTITGTRQQNGEAAQHEPETLFARLRIGIRIATGKILLFLPILCSKDLRRLALQPFSIFIVLEPIRHLTDLVAGFV